MTWLCRHYSHDFLIIQAASHGLFRKSFLLLHSLLISHHCTADQRTFTSSQLQISPSERQLAADAARLEPLFELGKRCGIAPHGIAPNELRIRDTTAASAVSGSCLLDVPGDRLPAAGVSGCRVPHAIAADAVRIPSAASASTGGVCARNGGTTQRHVRTSFFERYCCYSSLIRRCQRSWATCVFASDAPQSGERAKGRRWRRGRRLCGRLLRGASRLSLLLLPHGGEQRVLSAQRICDGSQLVLVACKHCQHCLTYEYIPYMHTHLPYPQASTHHKLFGSLECAFPTVPSISRHSSLLDNSYLFHSTVLTNCASGHS